MPRAKSASKRSRSKSAKPAKAAPKRSKSKAGKPKRAPNAYAKFMKTHFKAAYAKHGKDFAKASKEVAAMWKKQK